MRVDPAEELARSMVTGRRWQRRRGADRGAAPPPARVVLSGTSTESCIVSGITWMQDDDVDRLWRMYASPSARRQRRLGQRDDAILALAQLYRATSGRALAAAINTDLRRYSASGYRVNAAPPADDRRALLHRVLDLVGDGKIPSVGQIRGILAGMRS
jgi:hypothetical protein